MSEPSDEQLWSWVDRAAPELEQYLAEHPEARGRVRELEATIRRFELADPEQRLPERIGEFEIRGVLGRGGMGVVYDAEQSHPRRGVALKVLPGEFAWNEQWLRRFRREADALARLSHPGIASIYGVGRGEDGRPHIAMERVDGCPLGEYVERAKPSRRERILLAQKLCEAVGHAHDQGVIHRDIKPANILVGPDGTPVVVDFGLASIEDEQHTRASLMSRTGTLLGTLPYMSPEQVLGEGELAPSSDVYSLGVVVFELLAEQMPYDLKGLNLVAAASRIQTVRPRVRGKAKLALRGDLRSVLGKALAKEPERRYETAGELAADLRRVLDGRPVEIAARPLVRRALSFLRRHWFGSAFAAAVVLAGYLALLPPQASYPMIGAWWLEGSPFEDIRWRADTPEVLVDDRWYELEAIDDLKSAFIVGFCQQTSGNRWRKRFSEDLVQVLNRLGIWWLFSVDLTLRDLETGKVVIKPDVELNQDLRRRIWRGRGDWPWQRLIVFEGKSIIELGGRSWELVSVDGVPVERFGRPFKFDSYCDALGHSPGESIDFVVRDPYTGAERAFEDVPRATPLELSK